MTDKKPTLEEQIREADEKAGAAVATLEPTNGAVTEYEGADAGMAGNYDDDDLKLPTCSLVQPMSQGRGGAGTYWFAQEGRNTESFTAVVLSIISTAGMWGEVGSDAGLVCKSADRELGLTQTPGLVLGKPDLPEGAQYIACGECPHHADWNTKGGGPMMCKKGYTLLMCEQGDDVPFIFYVKGMAYFRVNDHIASPARLRYKRTGRSEPWLTPFTWTAEEVVQPGKKYWVPVIKAQAALDDERRNFYGSLAAQLSGKAQRQSEELAE